MLTGESQTWDVERTEDRAALEHVLHLMTVSVPADFACIYSYSHDLELVEPLVCYRPEAFPVALTAEFLQLAADYVALPPDSSPLVTSEFLETIPVQSALLLRLIVSGQTVGVVALFSDQANIYTLEDASRLERLRFLAQALLENWLLREQQNIARVIQQMTRALIYEATPQELVTSLHENLCGAHVAVCSMMFYGPQREDRPTGPFDYMEVVGSWSRTMGSGAGLGMKIYIEPYPDLITQLHEHKVMYIHDRQGYEHYLDPLTLGFIRAAGVRSILCVAVGVHERPLGIIFIGVDSLYEFKGYEVRSLQAVAEFISVSAMSQLLQHQQDFVRQAGADLLNAVTDGVMMVLPNMSRAHSTAPAHVLSVNQGFTRMFNVSQTNAYGMSLSQVMTHMQIPQDVAQRLYEIWISIPIRDPVTQRGEFNMVHPEGFPASIEWYSAPVYHDDRVMGRMYIFHDASASRTASSLRTNFIARVSHELRTPLTSIRGFAEFLLEELGDELPDLAREYTQIILNSARHLNNLFSEVIEIARADVGEMNLQITPVHLPDLIIDVTAQLNLQASEREMRVIMELDDNLPSVQMDANRIMQVLTNLLTNAIKYAPAGTRITIRTDRVTSAKQIPSGAPPDVVLPCVLVTVTDEGAGLSTDEAEQVFLPFYRGKEARAGQTEGSGLGLTVSRSIIELHRGKIWAEARRRGRKGARFLFTLPTTES